MDKSRLISRLQALKTRDNQKKDAPGQEEQSSPPEQLPGWEQVGKNTYRKISRHPNPFTIPLQDAGHPREDRSFNLPLIVQSLTGTVLPQAAVEQLLFFDLETTGLSGGAGTVAFLAGFGAVVEDDFIITQYFLNDYPGEPDFLKFCGDQITDSTLLVSFNGKSFDSNILRTRRILKRLPPNEPLAHLDLLYISRRLWKNTLESCSLSSLEEHILGIHREIDIPGAEVPDRYFQFLKDRMFQPLIPVFEHHHQDILSLASLLLLLHDIITGEAGPPGSDLVNLARLLNDHGVPEAEKILESRCSTPEAAWILSILYKRSSRWEKAVFLWIQSWEKNHHIPSLIELAKYFEHRIKGLKGYEQALQYTEQGLNELLKNSLHRDSGNMTAGYSDLYSIDLRKRQIRLQTRLKKR